jgi:hypothetical protein
MTFVGTPTGYQTFVMYTPIRSLQKRAGDVQPCCNAHHSLS